MTQHDAESRIGSIIAEKYRLLRLLGAGGMGAVYEAEHLFTQRRVALKLMHQSIARSGAAAERFLRESRAPSAIGHPGIVQVLDGGVDGGAPYVVLELLDGVALSDAIDQGMLDPQSIVEIGIELLDALQAAHTAGFVHRDIKPENVFLARDVRGTTSVRLLDFGIAGVEASDDNPKLTQTGAVLGTPLFMSPEQATGKRADHRSDLWSVGALLYNALAGHPPYSGDSYNALIVSIVTTDPIPLRNLRPELPGALLAVVERALRKDAALRFQSAADMGAALEAVTWSDDPATARRRSLPPMQSRRPPATQPEPFAVYSTPRAAPPAAALAARLQTTGASSAATGAGAWWWLIAAALVICVVAVGLLWRRAHARPDTATADAPAVTQPSAPAVAVAEPTQVVPTPANSPSAVADAGAMQPTAATAQPSDDSAKRAARAERDSNALGEVLEKHQSELQHCLEDAVMAQMQRGKTHVQTYKLIVELEVAALGRVARANVTGEAPADLIDCVRKSAQSFTFPAAAGADSYRFPLVLQPTIVGR